ncbi:MAG: acyl-CoA dehydrogenase family protein [Bradyrhizobiaceae bacterium]|nr:acyl-CoA dehydrogenase family protein [Bradyrhizobiaceae bacterium]
MTILVSAEQGEQVEAIRDMVRGLAQKVIAPRAAETDASEEFPWHVVEAFREAGLLSLLVPEEYGGAGGSVVHETAIAEELARVDVSSAIIFTSHSLCTEIIKYVATEAQKRHYLRRAVDGELIAIGLTEPGAGSDAASIQTSAKRTGDSYVLNGTKQYCTNGDVAGVILVFAVTAPGKGARGISVFAVERSNPGMRITRHEKKMGLHGTTTVEFVLEDCVVHESARLGPEHEGFSAAMFALARGRVAIAGVGVGLAQGAMEEAIGYARERRQFGQLIGAFQGVQFILADMAMEIEAARRLVERAAVLGMSDADGFRLASAEAKCFATDVAMRVATNAVQVFGGMGYMRGCPVERMMRDAKILQIFDGTNQIMRVLIARELIGKL